MMEIEDEFLEDNKDSQLSGMKDSNNSSTALAQTSTISLDSKRKYIKKTTQLFNQKAYIENELINYAKSQSLSVFPLYQSLQDRLDFILIGGDFLFKIQDYNFTQTYQQQQDLEGTMDLQLSLYKDVVSIHKKGDYLRVHLQNKFSGILDFRNFISQINQTMQIVSGRNHMDLLLKFQEILIKSHEAILQCMRLYPNPQELLELQQKRINYIAAYSYNYIKQNYNEDDFVVTGVTMLNFELKVPSCQNFSFSKAVVSLIGSNFEQLEAYFMRKGVKEFFDFRTRVLIQSNHIRSMLRDEKLEKLIEPFNLITYDDIQIRCFIQIETIYLDLPHELKYDKTSTEPDELETNELGFIMKILIQPDQLQDLINIRQERMKGDQQQDEMLRKEEDICYNMQSQYLIEKFYQQELQVLKNDEKFNYFSIEKNNKIEDADIIDPQSAQRCKYRPI